MIKEKCTVKKMKDNFGHLLIKVKVKNMYHQISMILKIIAIIQITKILSLSINVRVQEMVLNK
jgi:hypothetical protein